MARTFGRNDRVRLAITTVMVLVVPLGLGGWLFTLTSGFTAALIAAAALLIVWFAGLPMLSFLDQVRIDGDRLTARRMWSRRTVEGSMGRLLSLQFRLGPRPGSEDGPHPELQAFAVQLYFDDGPMMYFGFGEYPGLLEEFEANIGGDVWGLGAPVRLGGFHLVRYQYDDDAGAGRNFSYGHPEWSLTLYRYRAEKGEVTSGISDVVRAEFQEVSEITSQLSLGGAPMIPFERKLEGDREVRSLLGARSDGPVQAQPGGSLEGATETRLYLGAMGGELLKIRATSQSPDKVSREGALERFLSELVDVMDTAFRRYRRHH